MDKEQNKILALAKSVLGIEAEAIKMASKRLGQEFEEAVSLISQSSGNIILCGIGKSGHIAKKISTSFMSIGLNSIFLHAGEAIHGDLGIFNKGDITIVLSKSGSTSELVRLMPTFKAFETKVIAIVGRTDSPISKMADIVIDASVEKEADPLNLMPTASATVALALGDALASAVLNVKGFTSEEFARYHPGGQLGRNLLLKVEDVMHTYDKIALLKQTETLKDAVLSMTRSPLGAACIVDEDQKLLGIITDGDIRRAITKNSSVLDLGISKFYNSKPLTVDRNFSLKEALRLMEDRPSQISVIPVVDFESNKLLGLVRLHDIYQTDFS